MVNATKAKVTMKNTLFALLGFTLLTTPLAATAAQSGDFTFWSPDGLGFTIIGYTGLGGDVTIPGYLYDDDGCGCELPVKHIGDSAFYNQTNLTSVTIPGSVTSIGGSSAFAGCTSLTKVTIGNGLTSIGSFTFAFCTSLTNITIPGSITYIGYLAFQNCISLKGVFFKGNFPGSYGNAFDGASNATVYYLPGTTGWYGGPFNGAPTRLWNPLMQASGVGPAGFGFNITGTADIPIVIEAATNLANATWVPLQSLNLTNGAFYFNDPNWTNYPSRNYRIRSP
jgi:hypothetical protein